MIEETSSWVRKCADGIMVGIRYDNIVVKVLEIKARMMPARVITVFLQLFVVNAGHLYTN